MRLEPNKPPPYSVQRTPRGSVVVCAAHIVTDEIKYDEAVALAVALNLDYERTAQRQ